MINFPVLTDSSHGRVMTYGASGLFLSSLTPHWDHALTVITFLLHAFDGMTRFGGAVLIIAGWIKLIQERKNTQPKDKP